MSPYTTYVLSEWRLDSDGQPNVTVAYHRDYAGAMEEYDHIKRQIVSESEWHPYKLVTIYSKSAEEIYANQFKDSNEHYVIEKNYDRETSFYQDYGWKRPHGVSVTTVFPNSYGSLVWKTNVSSYPMHHRGKF